MTINDLIKRIQTALNTTGAKLAVDGVPGPMTLSAAANYDFTVIKREGNTMSALDLALKLIKEFEGLRLSAYLDGGGIPTIGYGHTKGVKMGDTCTVEEANGWVQEEVSSFMVQVSAVLTKLPNDNQLAALTSFAYNVGIGNFHSSTLLRLWNAGSDLAVVAHEFGRWIHDAAGNVEPGLVTRRADEATFFLS